MATEGMGSGISTKQKLMAVILIIVIAVIIWQVMGVMGSGSSSNGKNAAITPASAPAQPQPAHKPAAPMQPSANPAGATVVVPPAPNMMQQQPAPMTSQAANPAQPQAASNADIIKAQQDQQQAYLTSVNELQMLKLQRDIAETNQAIETARLATETAKKNITDLMAKPIPQPTPAGNYANSLVKPVQPSGDSNGAMAMAVPYTVISVSMQLNRWTAVLGYQGKLYSVSVGDVLPVDGWVVSYIGRDGVVLKKEDQTRKISLVPAI